MLLEALDADVIAATPGAILLSRPRHLREGRGAARPVRPGLRQGLQGDRDELRHRGSADPRGMAEGGRRALSDARADGGDQGARLLGRDHGDAEAAARGAAGPAPGRQQVDRHRRHLAVRQFAATIPKACGSAARAASGSAIKVWDKREFRNLDNQASSAPATSRSRSAACAASPAKARPTSSTSTRRSTAPRARAGSTSRCAPSGTMR